MNLSSNSAGGGAARELRRLPPASDALARARRAARQARALAGASGEALTPGRLLAESVARALDLPIAPLPEGDPLLAGARALLDRALWLVAVSRDLPPAAQTFSLAHELGHALLHTGEARCQTDAAAPPDAPDLDLDLDPALLETYSPWQRREAEANAFAAELLAPAALVRSAFLGFGGAAPLGPAQIAAAAGVAEGLALAQLSAALLGGGPPDGEAGEEADVSLALDPDQEAAASAATGPVAVDAGPGAGKTRTLAARAAHLVRSGAAAPGQVLVLTFSTAAAAELRRRLDGLLPDAGVRVSTIHGWALDLLRRYSGAAGLPYDLRVLDGFAARRLLEGLLPGLPLSFFRNLHDPGEPLAALLHAISRAQDEAWSPGDFAARAAALRERGAPEEWAGRAAEAAAAYGAYLDALADQGAVDFGEMVRRALDLLRSQPEVRAALRVQHRAVLVDEYQDTNRAAALLLRELTGDGGALWVVGDARQAIYRFRGAAPGNFSALAADFPGARRLPLRRNYRSRPLMVAALQAAAAALVPGEPALDWQATRRAGGGPSLFLASAPTGEAELRGLAPAIAARRAAGVPLRDQAVLCRTHAQADAVTAALGEAGLPALAARSLTGAAAVREALGLLALLAGDPGGLLPLAPAQGVVLTRDDLHALAAALRRDGLAALADAPGLSPAGAALARDAAEQAAAVARSGTPDVQRLLLRAFFAGDGPVRRLASLPQEAAAPELAALRHLAALAAAARRDPLAPPATWTPGAFLVWLRARLAAGESRVPAPEAAGDAVPVLTVHAAKGREFPVVYVPNLAAGRFPPRARPAAAPLPPDLDSLPEPVNLDEEAALLFVAMSRARDALVLSYAGSYDGVPAQPSPLLRRLSGVFAALPPVRLRWDAPPTGSDAASGGAVPERQFDHRAAAKLAPDVAVAVEFDDLMSYRRCPRRHYYAAVLGLAAPQTPGAGDGSLLAESASAALAWLWERVRDGEAATPGQAAAFVRSWWEQRDGAAHPYGAEVLRAAEGAARRAAALPRTAVAPWRVAAEHGGARITAQADAAAHTEEGALRLVIALTGGAGEAERAAVRAAALRAGARRAGYVVEIDTVALITGDRRPLPENPAEDAARLSQLAAAARALAAGEFPARPDRRNRCALCPFVLICPS